MFAATALIVIEIGIELRQAHHRHAAFRDGSVENAGVVGREEVDVALVVAGPESQGLCHRLRISLQIAVNGGEPDIGRDEGGRASCRERV